MGWGALRRRIREVDPARALNVPTLLIAGERDLPAVESTRALQELLPDARRVIVAGAGHIANLEKPESFNEALRSFLSGIEAER